MTSPAHFHFTPDLAPLLAPGQRTGPVPAVVGAGTTIKHAVESLGVPHTEIAALSVNGVFVAFDYQVRPADEIRVAGPLSPPAGAPPLRPPLQSPIRFLLDNHLGRLARFLRLVGLDTLYFHDELDDPQLADLAAAETRVLLTRDRRLLMRKQIVYGYWLPTRDSQAQLTAVLHRYGLHDQLQPWSRCLRCNGFLRPVSKEAVWHLLEPKTKRYFEEFKQCGDCGQVFWQGSHFAALQATVAAAAGQG